MCVYVLVLGFTNGFFCIKDYFVVFKIYWKFFLLCVNMCGIRSSSWVLNEILIC